MDSMKEWEAILAGEGMPSELPTETDRAAEAGVDLVSLDVASGEAQALALKLKEEDPRNLFGGFPSSLETLVSLIKDLRSEWVKAGVPENFIHLTIHASCINGKDCVTLSRTDGNRYHYNTKNILKYSREKTIQFLTSSGISFREEQV
jgi:hypothetical protein